MEENSGVTFHEAQVAQARLWLGTPFPGEESQEKVVIKTPQPSGEGLVVTSDTKTESQDVPLPKDEGEAREIIRTFEYGASEVRGDEDVSDTVAQHLLRDETSLLDEKWLGTEEEELDWYILIFICYAVTDSVILAMCPSCCISIRRL